MSSDKEILLKKKRELFSLLARTVIADSYEPVIGNSLRREILSSMEDEKDKELRMASISSSMARRAKIGQALDAAREKLSVLRSEETEARLRLGLVLFEARKDGALDGRIDFMEEDYATYIRLQQQSRSPIKRVLTKIDLSGFEKDLANRYVSYSKELFSRGLEDLVEGGEFDALKDRILLLGRKIEAQENAESLLEGKLESEISQYGEEYEEKESSLPAMMEGYGSYLFESGQKWIDQDTPDDILDIISEILEVERAIDEAKCIERTEDERRKALEIDALINDSLSRIDALEKERKRIDDKINEIRREIKQMEEEKNSLLGISSERSGL